MKTVNVEKARFVGYRNRAREFFNTMNDEVDIRRYNAAALLGVHAAIALADAVTIREAGKRAADGTHSNALLKSVCSEVGVNGDGWTRLGAILARKNDVAYAGRYTSEDSPTLKLVRLNVERLFGWAQKNFTGLWQDCPVISQGNSTAYTNG